MKKITKYLILAFLILTPFFKINAATGLIDVYSSSKRVLVGNSITVTIYCESATAIGTCEYTLNYDSSKLKLTSGQLSVADVVSNNTTKSMKKTFTFKVISSGTSTISVKSYAIRDFNSGAQMSTSVSPVSVTGITQAQLEASYSTNNYLSNLSVSGHTISPAFKKDTTEYKVTLDPNIEKITVNATKADNTASVSGGGTIEVSEGDNKINIIVTSQKGTKRTYTLIATVIDNNPINVNINDKNYTVVKRTKSLEKPDTFEAATIKINNIDIPGFFSEITNYHLVGLKDEQGIISLAIYNIENNTYELYQELNFNNLTLNILNEKINIPDNYNKTAIKIGDKEVVGYKQNDVSKYSLIYALNVETGEKHIYMYDEVENTAQIYNNEEITILKDKLNFANILIYIFGGSTLFLSILLIIVAASKTKKRKEKLRKKDKKETKEQKKEKKIFESNIKEKIVIEKKDKEKEIKKEIIELKNDEENSQEKKKKPHDMFEDL